MGGTLDFEQITDFGPVVHYVARATGDFPRVYVSAAIQRLLGYEPDEFTADPSFWASRIHPGAFMVMLNIVRQYFSETR